MTQIKHTRLQCNFPPARPQGAVLPTRDRKEQCYRAVTAREAVLPSRDREGAVLPSRDREGAVLPSRDREGGGVTEP
jgi:hypothetical protein